MGCLLDLCSQRARFDCAGETGLGIAAAGVPFGAQRTATDGADTLQLLFRWFVGLAMEDWVWDRSVFSKNRDRLLEHEVIESFFSEVLALAEQRKLLSKDHFSVDGTLIQAWASQKSFRPKDGPNPPPGGGRNA